MIFEALVLPTPTRSRPLLAPGGFLELFHQ